MIHLARTINDNMPEYTVRKVQSIFRENNIQNGRVAVLGLAFKSNIDDMRESPSLEVINFLNKMGIDYTAFDPHIKENKVKGQTQNFQDVINHTDLILILTSHDEFSQIDPSKLDGLRSKIILDTKNCINRNKWREAGFQVYTLGDAKNI